jgi:RNA polymerase sigma-70 factor (ECF subfamily)
VSIEENHGLPASPDSIEVLFDKAVREHSRRLISVARAIVGSSASAEDVVQQAFMNLYRHRRRYDWRDPGGLLRRTVVNEALRLLRQNRPVALVGDAGENKPEPLDAMVDRESVASIRKAIANLPQHFRAALVLCEYEQMSYAQIAEVLGASIPQVKTWIFRGRRQLAQTLKELAPAS